MDDDEKPLSFYNITTNAVIHAVLSDRVNHGNSNLNDQNANPENTMAQPSGNGRNVQFGGAQVVFVDGNSNQTMGQFSIPANGVNPMAFLNNLNLSGMLGNGSGNIVIGSGNGEPQILDFGSMASMGQNNNGNNNNIMIMIIATMSIIIVKEIIIIVIIIPTTTRTSVHMYYQ